jgi:hypothetical protein
VIVTRLSKISTTQNLSLKKHMYNHQWSVFAKQPEQESPRMRKGTVPRPVSCVRRLRGINSVVGRVCVRNGDSPTPISASPSLVWPATSTQNAQSSAFCRSSSFSRGIVFVQEVDCWKASQGVWHSRGFERISVSASMGVPWGRAFSDNSAPAPRSRWNRSSSRSEADRY